LDEFKKSILPNKINVSITILVILLLTYTFFIEWYGLEGPLTVLLIELTVGVSPIIEYLFIIFIIFGSYLTISIIHLLNTKNKKIKIISSIILSYSALYLLFPKAMQKSWTYERMILIFVLWIILVIIYWIIKLLIYFLKKVRILIIIPIMFLFLSLSIFALEDSNPDNNFKNISVNVVETDELSLHFVKIESIKHPLETNAFNIHVEDHVNFLKKTYPLADDAVTHTSGMTAPVTKNTIKRAYYEFAKRKEFYGNYSVDLFAGLAPLNFTGDTDGRWDDDYPNTVLSRHTTFTTTAHEIGHSFGLCDELNTLAWHGQNLLYIYKGVGGCPNAKEGAINYRDACKNTCYTKAPDNDLINGCEVENKSLIDDLFLDEGDYPYEVSDDLINLMGASDSLAPNTSRWINHETYMHLLRKLNITNMTSNRNKRNYSNNSVLMIPGFHNISNDQPTFDSSYMLNGGFLSNPEDHKIGNYSIIAKNALGKILHAYNYSPSNVTYDDGNYSDVNISYFIFKIPAENVSTIQIVFNETELLLEHNKSSNTPIINISTNLSDNSYYHGSHFNLNWTIADEDNDTVSHAIVVVDEEGNSINTIDIDVQDTNYTINTSYMPVGYYSLKVIASDGFNSAENISGIFEIKSSAELEIGTVKENEDSFSTKLLFKLNNTLPTNLENFTSWYIDLGDGNRIEGDSSINLSSHESIFISTIHEYEKECANYSIQFGAYLNGVLNSVETNLNHCLLDLHTINVTKQNDTAQIWVLVNNTGISNITGIRNWSIDFGDNYTMNGTIDFNLSKNESMIVSAIHEYVGSGTYSVKASLDHLFIHDEEEAQITI